MKGLQSRLCVSTILALGIITPAFAQTAPGTPAGSVPATPSGQATGASAGETPGTPSGGTAGSPPAAASAGPNVSTAPASTTTRVAEPAGEGGDIIVTARRTEERLQDVPISITVFNQAQVTNRNIVTAGDLGTYTPSLSSNGRFGSDNSSFAIRGFVQETQTAPSVGVYFADVVAPRSQGGTTSGNGAGVGNFFDLQNVQVLKGPQGTLFGRNTTGGAVLLVPQKPTSRLEGYVEGSYGNYDMKRIQGVINIPVMDTLRVRLGADYQDRDGYLKNVSGIGPKDFNDVHYYSFRASVVADLTSNLENYLIGTFVQSNTNGPAYKVVGCNPNNGATVPTLLNGFANLFPYTFGGAGCAQAARGQGRNFYDVENGNTNPGQYTQQWQLINTTTWAASDTITIKNIASYSEFRQNQSTALFGENFTTSQTRLAAFSPGNYHTSFVDLYNHPGYNNVSEWTVTNEIQLQGRTSNDRFTYQGGFYFEKSGPIQPQGTYAAIGLACPNAQALQCTDYIGNYATAQLYPLVAAQLIARGVPAATAALLAPSLTPHVNIGNVTESFSEYNFRNLGVYAQGTYKISDKLSVTGGIRYTSDRVSSVGEVRLINFAQPNVPSYKCAIGGQAAPTPLTCAQYVTEKSSKPTWLIDLDYKPIEDILLYAKYARGYRAGGLNSSNPGFSTWNPEKVDTYEVGAKTSWRGAIRGTFNVAGFYNNFSNQQLTANTVPIPGSGGGALSPIINAGKSRIWGVEVDASLIPVRSIEIDVGYTYLNTKLKSFTPPAFDTTLYSALVPTARVGGPLILSPKNRVTVTGTYTLPVSSDVGRVSVGATFTHTDKFVTDYGVPSIFGVQPATNLLNLNLNWNSVFGTKFDVTAFVTNLTQRKYTVYNAGAYNSTGFEAEALGQPRMFGGRLRYRFGH